jgi:hypothetical protein
MSVNDEYAFSVTSEGKLVLQNLLGKYNAQKGEIDEALYLKAFSGDFWRSNRITRDSVVLNEPYMSCLWFVQIKLMQRLIAKKELIEGGLLPRFLFCVCVDPIPKIDPELGPPNPELIDWWAKLCTALLRTYYSGESIFRIQMDHKVYVRFVEFANAAIDRMNNGMEDVQSFVARWCEIAYRISLVLHIALYGAKAHTVQLSLKTAENAMELIKYYAEVQMNLLAPSEDEHFDRARKLYQILIERYKGAETLRTLMQNHKYKEKELTDYAAKYKHMFKIEEIPTTARGTPKRMMSIVRDS